MGSWIQFWATMSWNYLEVMQGRFVIRRRTDELWTSPDHMLLCPLVFKPTLLITDFLAFSQVSRLFITFVIWHYFFFYCLIVSHQDWKAVTAPSLWNDLLFKQPSNGISDREIRLQCLGFSEIKSLIDGRKDEKGFSPWFCQWLWLYGNLNRATFELRQSRQLVAFVLYVHVYRF